VPQPCVPHLTPSWLSSGARVRSPSSFFFALPCDSEFFAAETADRFRASAFTPLVENLLPQILSPPSAHPFFRTLFSFPWLIFFLKVAAESRRVLVVSDRMCFRLLGVSSHNSFWIWASELGFQITPFSLSTHFHILPFALTLTLLTAHFT